MFDRRFARRREVQPRLLPLTMAVGLFALTLAGVAIEPPRRLQVIEPGPILSDEGLDGREGTRKAESPLS